MGTKTLERKYLINFILLLILSNLCVYLFSSGDSNAQDHEINQPHQQLDLTNHTEIKIKAQIHIPFENGKRVNLMNSSTRQSISNCILVENIQLNQSEEFLEAKTNIKEFILYVPTKYVSTIIRSPNWEIIPASTSINFNRRISYDKSF